MNRRTLVRTAIMLPIGFVVGCNGSITGVAQQTAQYVADIANAGLGILNAVSNGISSIVPNSGSITDFLAKIGTYVSSLGALAAKIVPGLDLTAGQPIMQQIGNIISSIGGALSGAVNVPAIVSKVFGLVQQLWPLAASAFGLVTAALAPMASGDSIAVQLRAATSEAMAR